MLTFLDFFIYLENRLSPMKEFYNSKLNYLMGNLQGHERIQTCLGTTT